MLRNQQNKSRLKPGTLLLPNTQLSTADKLKYAQKVFQDYKRYGGELLDDLNGKRILELGPGDNHVVALQFLLGGASHITALDKFRFRHDTEHQSELYGGFRSTLDAADQARAPCAPRRRHARRQCHGPATAGRQAAPREAARDEEVIR